MTTRHSSSSAVGRPARPWLDDLADRIPGGRRNARIALVALAVLLITLVVLEIVSTSRVAQWAPVEVVTSREPLQDLPIRLASADGVVRPAHTYDAVIDMKSLEHLVVGVDLDYLPRQGTRRDVVIRAGDGAEMFRAAVPESYFTEGRFMLRLFSRHFPSGDYTLEIEALEDIDDNHVVAASWFQVSR